MSPGNHFRIEFIFNLIKRASCWKPEPFAGSRGSGKKSCNLQRLIVSDRDLKQTCDRITPKPFLRMCSFFLIITNILETLLTAESFRKNVFLTGRLPVSSSAGKQVVQLSVWHQLEQHQSETSVWVSCGLLQCAAAHNVSFVSASNPQKATQLTVA